MATWRQPVDRSPAPAPRPSPWVIFAITATGITVNTLITSALPEILAGVGATRGSAGLVIGAATLPGIILAPVIGLLADRFGRREVLVPCLAVFAVAGGLAALAPSLWLLVLLRVLQGAGSAGLINLAVVLIGDHWEGTERATMIGRNVAVLAACLALFPLVGGALTDLASWRAPFLVYPLGLVTAVLVARNLPRGAVRGDTVGEQLRELGPALRQTSIVGALGAGMVTFALIFGLLLTVMPLHLEQAFGLSATARGLVLGLPALPHTVIALRMGWLSRFARHRQMLVASGLFAAVFAAVGGLTSLPVVLVAVLAFGAAEGLVLSNLQDLVVGTASAASRGAVMALFVSSARLGQTLGPIGAGLGLQAAGAQATFWVGAVVAVAVLAPLVALARVPREGYAGGSAPSSR